MEKEVSTSFFSHQENRARESENTILLNSLLLEIIDKCSEKESTTPKQIEKMDFMLAYSRLKKNGMNHARMGENYRMYITDTNIVFERKGVARWLPANVHSLSFTQKIWEVVDEKV